MLAGAPAAASTYSSLPCRAHSILFCRTWTSVFSGVDTHINLYINTHESIFLSFLLLKLHGRPRMSLYRRQFCTPLSAARERINAFCPLLPTFADAKGGDFFL